MQHEQFVKDVLEAFLSGKAKPKQEQYGGYSDNSCCALGAIRYSDNKLDESAYLYTREKYSLTDLYLNGLLSGFDNITKCIYEKENSDFTLGYDDGKSIWESVKHLA